MLLTLITIPLLLTTPIFARPAAHQKRTTTTQSGSSVNGRTFDYVIVGGGLGGSVLARRLAEGGKASVLVVEAGQDQESNQDVYDAGRYQSTFDGPLDYAYKTTDQSGSGSKTIRAGKMLGGSTGINGLAWTKPHDFQLDGLENVGNQGVNWNVLDGYMKKAENFGAPGSGYVYTPGCHASGGPISVQYDSNSSPGDLELLFNQTVLGLGVPYVTDLTCGNPAGAAQNAATKNNGNTRISSYRGYLWNQDIPNLTILTQAQVGKILFSSDSSLTASGIEFRDASGTTYTALANLEVILSAGSIKSPVILQQSGIGPSSVLSSAGITQRLDLSGVGKNLVDQITTTTNSRFTGGRGGAQPILFPRFEDLFSGDDATRVQGVLSTESLAKYAQDAVDAGAADNAEGLQTVLELQKDWILNRGAGMAESFDYSYDSTLGYDSWNLITFSRGYVKVNSNDPYDDSAIEINPRYLTTEIDELASAGITRFTRTVSTSAPLDGSVPEETTPGTNSVPTGAGLDGWADWVKGNYRSNWHPIGTAAMMSKDMGGCVDSDYKVYGVNKLRVVDASLLPFQVSAHLMSVLYGLAERAADVINAAHPNGGAGGGSDNGGGNPSPAGGKLIHPNGDRTKCLTVAGTPSDGSAVTISDCSNSAGQKWDIVRGSTAVKLAGSNYCLDTGSPANGVKGKVWTCYDNLAAQKWYYTDAGDDHIAVEGAGQCLDLTDGKTANGTPVQTWACDGQNANQHWTLE